MKGSSKRREGFTLVEVLLAMVILSVGMVVLMTAASRCLAVMKRAKQYQDAQMVLGKGLLEYPIDLENIEDLFELEVDGDADVEEGYRFYREIEEDTDEESDNLHIMRTRVVWMMNGREQKEEIVQYVYFEEKDD